MSNDNVESGFSGRTVILASVFGAIAGAAAVLLLAPRTRRELTNRIREVSHDLNERASAAIDTAREKISSGVARGRDFIDEKRSVISSAVEAGKQAYERKKDPTPSGG